MRCNALMIVLICSCFFGQKSNAQLIDELSKKEAIEQTLQNNFGITIANNNLEVADNNRDLLNSGYLPSLTGNAGGSYDNQNQEVTFQNGESNAVDGAVTKRYNASLNLNYTLFDGLGRYWDYKAFKEQYKISELQVRETMETTIIQMFSVYFEVARITENITVLEETYANTQRRLKRAGYAFEYGQNSKLDVLNAEVDLVTDSINLLNAKQLLKNTKRDLNVISNLALERDFNVDTTVTFVPQLVIENYIKDADTMNVRILQAKKNRTVSDYNYKSSKSFYLPTVGLTGSYGWNEGQFPITSFATQSTSTGLSAGLNLTWNLFDGGRSITTMRNAKIEIANQEVLINQIEKEVDRDILNAQGNYINLLKVYELQAQNVVTAINNFERSNEQYKIGQISSVELRQAQLNLLNTKTNKNLAKYQAKLAELQVLQLTGQLLNVDL